MAQGQFVGPAELQKTLKQAIESNFVPVALNEFSQGLDRFNYLNENVVAPYPADGTQAEEWDQQAFANYHQPDTSDPRRQQAEADNKVVPLATEKDVLGSSVPAAVLLANPAFDQLVALRLLADSFFDPSGSPKDNAINLTGVTSTFKQNYNRERPEGASESDPSYNSGHTTLGFALETALAWVFPERGEEAFSRALNFGESRVVRGSHYPTDTIASRAISYYETSRLLDDENTRAFIVNSAKAIRAPLDLLLPEGLKASLESQPNTISDQYRANNDEIGYYGQAAEGAKPGTSPDNIPTLATNMVLLRYPYLSVEDRQTVLAGTSYPENSLAGFMVQQGDPDSYWALLDLPNAYRGPAEIDRDLNVNQRVTNDDIPGYGNNDTWKNDITGSGHLTKSGNGDLTLTGNNDFGGIEVDDGTLTLTGNNQFDDTLYVNGGTLVVDGTVTTPVVLQGGTLSGTGTIENLTVNGGNNAFGGSVVHGPTASAAQSLAADSAAHSANAHSPNTLLGEVLHLPNFPFISSAAA